MLNIFKTLYRIDESAVEAQERISKWDEFLAEEEAEQKEAQEPQQQKQEQAEQQDSSPETQLLPGDATP